MSKGMNKNTSINTVRLISRVGSDMNWNTKKNKQLLEAILALKNVDETKRFLRDIMTEGEINEFANRLEAASLLSSDVQYNAITEKTGLSSATIARIAKWLYGSLGGYRLVLARLNKTNHHSPIQIRKGFSLN